MSRDDLPAAIAFHPDFDYAAYQIGGRAVIVSGGFDGSVRVWDLESGEPVLAPITGHEGAVYAVVVLTLSIRQYSKRTA